MSEMYQEIVWSPEFVFIQPNFLCKWAATEWSASQKLLSFSDKWNNYTWEFQEATTLFSVSRCYQDKNIQSLPCLRCFLEKSEEA